MNVNGDGPAPKALVVQRTSGEVTKALPPTAAFAFEIKMFVHTLAQPKKVMEETVEKMKVHKTERNRMCDAQTKQNSKYFNREENCF